MHLGSCRLVFLVIFLQKFLENFGVIGQVGLSPRAGAQVFERFQQVFGGRVFPLDPFLGPKNTLKVGSAKRQANLLGRMEGVQTFLLLRKVFGKGYV